jgi:hypothetical protein
MGEKKAFESERFARSFRNYLHFEVNEVEVQLWLIYESFEEEGPKEDEEGTKHLDKSPSLSAMLPLREPVLSIPRENFTSEEQILEWGSEVCGVFNRDLNYMLMTELKLQLHGVAQTRLDVRKIQKHDAEQILKDYLRETRKRQQGLLGLPSAHGKKPLNKNVLTRLITDAFRSMDLSTVSGVTDSYKPIYTHMRDKYPIYAPNSTEALRRQCEQWKVTGLIKKLINEAKNGKL